jgi:rhamnosyl/mannosyltransferase
VRVLHIYKSYPPVLGGIERHLHLLAAGQARRALDVTVLVTAPTGATRVTDADGVRIIRAAPTVTLGSTPVSLAMIPWLRRLEPDVTHLHFPYPPGEALRWAFGRAGAIVVTYHSDIVRQRVMHGLYRPLLWRVLGSAHCIIATSPRYAATSRYLRALSARCHVVPLGIDPKPFLDVDARRVQDLQRSHGRPLVLFVGRHRYYKGLEVLLDAMRRVEATLVVVGDGPMTGRWRRLAEKSLPADRVRFVGEVPDAELPAYYGAACVLVLPSTQRSEGFGLVQLEAMAAGTPVISTELGTGTTFVNRDGETGLVVPPAEPTALARAVGALLADPGRREAMGRRGRERVLAEFTADTMVERVLDVYRAALRRNS